MLPEQNLITHNNQKRNFVTNIYFIVYTVDLIRTCLIFTIRCEHNNTLTATHPLICHKPYNPPNWFIPDHKNETVNSTCKHGSAIGIKGSAISIFGWLILNWNFSSIQLATCQYQIMQQSVNFEIYLLVM